MSNRNSKPTDVPVISATDQQDGYTTLLEDVVTNLQNENRELRKQLGQKRQDLQDHKKALDKSQVNHNPVIVIIDSNPIKAKQITGETKTNKSDKPIVAKAPLNLCRGNKKSPVATSRRGELTWTINEFDARKRELLGHVIRCLDSAEFETAPSGYRLRLRFWMSDTGIEIGVKMLESSTTAKGGLLWPVSCRVTISVFDHVEIGRQFLDQKSLVIEYKTASFCSQSIMRFPSALIVGAARQHDLIVIHCSATDFH